MLWIFIRRKFEQKDTKDEEVETEELFNEFFNKTNIDLNNLINLDKNKFQNTFTPNQGFNSENIELLADFLVQFSSSSTITNNDELRKKAIEIYEYIDVVSRTYSVERTEKI
jgi:hypothetical protein